MVVLVAYATDHGSTAVASPPASQTAFRQGGVDAKARAVTDVLEVARAMKAVVLGSAIHGRKWLYRRGDSSLTETQRRCGERPVWLFSVSTVGDEESMFPPRVANLLRSLRKETPEPGGAGAPTTGQRR